MEEPQHLAEGDKTTRVRGFGWCACLEALLGAGEPFAAWLPAAPDLGWMPGSTCCNFGWISSLLKSPAAK